MTNKTKIKDHILKLINKEEYEKRKEEKEHKMEVKQLRIKIDNLTSEKMVKKEKKEPAPKPDFQNGKALEGLSIRKVYACDDLGKDFDTSPKNKPKPKRPANGVIYAPAPRPKKKKKNYPKR